MGDTTTNNNATHPETIKMIRKGAVAAVGGTMTAVGLVMIPLPTPFGAVIASSGLAVLGTEFDEAKELNDKLIEGAKGHLNTARDAIVNGIERMDRDDFDAGCCHDDDGDDDDDPVVPDTDSVTDSSSDTEDDNAFPIWLNMNALERKRQERIAKEKYRRENQTYYEKKTEYSSKRTGQFLSRNVLPFIKRKDTEEESNS